MFSRMKPNDPKQKPNRFQTVPNPLSKGILALYLCTVSQKDRHSPMSEHDNPGG